MLVLGAGALAWPGGHVTGGQKGNGQRVSGVVGLLCTYARREPFVCACVCVCVLCRASQELRLYLLLADADDLSRKAVVTESGDDLIRPPGKWNRQASFVPQSRLALVGFAVCDAMLIGSLRERYSSRQSGLVTGYWLLVGPEQREEGR